MRTHPLPTTERAPRRGVGPLLLLVPAMLGGCVRNPTADADAAQALTELGHELAAVRQESAALQNQLDSLRLAVARQDTLLRRLANMAGVPMP